MTALKDTIVKIFWEKKHMRKLLQNCNAPLDLINAQNWDLYKYHVLEPILEALNSMPEGLGPLRCILQQTLSYKDANHLLRYNDGKKRKREAENSLEHLRTLVQQHDQEHKDEEAERERRKDQAQREQKVQRFHQRLEELKNKYLIFFSSKDVQKRGYNLEALLRDLFELFDLEPRGSFKVKGEQIDGAFELDGDDYLIEIKWQNNQVELNDLRDLDGAIRSNLDNTLGLFVSINGFNANAIEKYSQGDRPRIICMDGTDLMSVLEGHIELPELLKRKRALAAQKGKIFVCVGDIMKGKE